MDKTGKGEKLLSYSLFLILSGCMGGGGGGSSSSGPSEIAYILTQDSTNNAGAVVEYALNPDNGTFYSGSNELATNGTVPVSFLLGPSNTTAFVLNNNSPTGDASPQSGSIAVYSVGTTGLSGPSLSTPISTGPNPVDMAVDPGGNFLVVANHGNGTTSGSPLGYVQVYAVGAGGALTLAGLPSANSPCNYPLRAVFGPNAAGKTSDVVFVACSSPELSASSTSPPPLLYSCTIVDLKNGTGCTPFTSVTGVNFIVTMLLDPSSTYLVAPGVSTSGGVLMVCTIGNYSCSSAAMGNITLPSTKIAFSASGANESIFVGNYNSSNSSSFNGNAIACTVLSSPSCPSTNEFTLSQNGPIAFATNTSQTTVYIAATQTPVPNTLTGSGAPTSGSLYAYSIPLAPSSTPSTSQTTGGWPVDIALDPSGNYLFVPSLSGTVSVFQVTSGQGLSPIKALPVPSPLVPFSVTVH